MALSLTSLVMTELETEGKCRTSLESPAHLLNAVAVAAAAAKSGQSSLTLCNPIDGSPTGSSVPGILQGRTLE